MPDHQNADDRAQELYPNGSAGTVRIPSNEIKERERAAYVFALRVSAEQIEKATEAHYDAAGRDEFKRPWQKLPVTTQASFRKWERAAFRAAGFIVEGGE